MRGKAFDAHHRHNLRAPKLRAYVPDPEPASVFAVTAYELAGKALLAYRRRRKRKGKR